MKAMNLRISFYILTLEILFHSSTVLAADKMLLCFYNSDWLNKYGFTMDDIDPNLCTHMAFSYISIANKGKGIEISSEFLDPQNEKSAFSGLKIINPNIKSLIVTKQLAPFSWESIDFIDKFAEDVVAFLKHNKYDGVILDFVQETTGFRNAVSALKKAFEPNGFLIIAAGDIEKTISNEGDYVANMSRDLDFLMLESYNFYESDVNPNWATFSSPLYNLPGENTKFYQDSQHTLHLRQRQNATVDSIVSYWINNGYPPSKLIVGILLLGSSWQLETNEINPPAPAKDTAPARNFTKMEGKMSYSEVCAAVKTEGWQVFQGHIVNSQSIGAYAVSPAGSSERTWVSYENQDSAVSKSKYILSKGLGGALVSRLPFDDFGNRCGAGHYPVTTAIRTTLIGPYQRVDFRKPSVIGRANAENLKIFSFCNVAIYVWLTCFSMLFPFIF